MDKLSKGGKSFRSSLVSKDLDSGDITKLKELYFDFSSKIFPGYFSGKAISFNGDKIAFYMTISSQKPRLEFYIATLK